MALGDPIRANALVAFKVRNVRSYRDATTLSMQATRVAKADVVRTLQTASAAPERVLPVAGVFGANAAGKSTILKAIADMRAVVLGSFKNAQAGVHRRPFLLNPKRPHATSEFAVDLILDGVWWQYGFEFDDERILREFAFHYPHARQALVFERDRDTLSFGPAFRALGTSLRKLIRENSLLLSIIGAAAENAISPLFQWWQPNAWLAAAYNRAERTAFTANSFETDASRARALQLLRGADLGLADVKVVPPDHETVDRMKRAMRVLLGDEANDEEAALETFDEVRLVHGEGTGVTFELADESMGTLVWFGLIGPVLDALDRGRLLLLDELDASLHPLLANKLIELFQSPDTNPHCAQLIFNAHDTTLLDDKSRLALGRDQIWFANRDDGGASRLVPLADFKARRDESVGRRYLRGRYGGTPNLDALHLERAREPAQAHG